MGGYSDGYEDLDEYEDEEAEGEEYEEYEEEEDPEPKKEVQDYLVLRQRLKEQKREKLKKELGPGNTPSNGKYSIPKSKDKYGSFFGSSQPIIADRVIQESKSLLENPDFLAKAMKSKNMVNKSSSPASVSSKSQAVRHSPKVASGITKKIQMLKNSRDYSFLESDDVQPPERSKDPPRNVSAPTSEARVHQLPERNKDSSSMAGRKAPSTRDGKKPTPINGHVRPKVEGDRLPPADKHKKPVSDSVKQLSISNRTLADGRKHIPSNIASGPGRPMVSKSVASQISGGGAERRIAVPTAKSSTSLAQKPAPPKLKPPVSKLQPPISKQSAGKREHEESRRQKVLPRQTAHEELRKQTVLPKQGGAPLKPKVTQPPPKSSARSVDDRPRKRPPRPLDDNGSAGGAISMIRQMFGYNPNRYRDEDYDDRDMEANFRQIEMEEKRSARIAKQEDEEELRKIEEEERRERMRREAKKRKLR